VLFCYAFGKAQRILHALDPAIGPIVAHGAVETLNRVYRQTGVVLPPTLRVDNVTDAALLRRALVLAPPSAAGSGWMRRFGDYSDAFASGWMRLRGARRRRGVDRGFVVSDHADWPGLCGVIAATGAQRVFVTHGNVAVLVRWLTEQGLDAQAFTTEYGSEEDDNGGAAAAVEEDDNGGAAAAVEEDDNGGAAAAAEEDGNGNSTVTAGEDGGGDATIASRDGGNGDTTADPRDDGNGNATASDAEGA
jgi:putative mRNA 3-end processing factor